MLLCAGAREGQTPRCCRAAMRCHNNITLAAALRAKTVRSQTRSSSNHCTSDSLPCAAHAISSDEVEICFWRPTAGPVQQSNLSQAMQNVPGLPAASVTPNYPRALSVESNATLSKAFPGMISRLCPYAAIGVSICVGPSGYFSNFCLIRRLPVSAS